MRKMCVFALAALVLLGCVGCGSDPAEEPQEEFFFLWEGNLRITPGAEAAPILETLGEPKGYTEEASCAFDGLDKTYDYGGFCLTTCPMEGQDYVYSLWFVDDTVSTSEGIRIGSTRAEVEAILGSDAISRNACRETRGDTRRIILLREDVVYSVQYELLLD